MSEMRSYLSITCRAPHAQHTPAAPQPSSVAKGEGSVGFRPISPSHSSPCLCLTARWAAMAAVGEAEPLAAFNFLLMEIERDYQGRLDAVGMEHGGR